MINVELFDRRQGHNGAANGGNYGYSSSLFVRVKPGQKLEEAVTTIVDKDDGSYPEGRNSVHWTDRKITLSVDPDKVEWGVIIKFFEAHPMMGREDREYFYNIPGIPSSPYGEIVPPKGSCWSLPRD